MAKKLEKTAKETKKTVATPITRYEVDDEGVISVKNFKARTFAEALDSALVKGWETKPAKFASAVAASPDLLTVVIGIMNSFEEFLAKERAKIEESASKRLVKLERECEKKKVEFGASVIEEDNEMRLLFKTLTFFDTMLYDLETKAPVEWVKGLGKTEFNAVIEGVIPFLKERVNEAWCVFSPALDTAHGKAVEDMRNIDARTQDALELKFCLADNASLPLAVATDLTAKEATKIAKARKLPFTFSEVKGLAAKEVKAPKKAKAVKATKEPKKAVKAKKVVAKKTATKKSATKKAPAKKGK